MTSVSRADNPAHRPRIGYAVESGKASRFFDEFRQQAAGSLDLVNIVPDAHEQASGCTELMLGTVPQCSIYIHKLASYEPGSLVNFMAGEIGGRVLDPVRAVAVLEDRAATCVALEAAFAAENATSACVEHDASKDSGDAATELFVPAHSIVAPFMTDEEIADVLEIHDMKFPVIVKPRRARTHTNIFMCHTMAQLRNVLRANDSCASSPGSSSWDNLALAESMHSWQSVGQSSQTSKDRSLSSEDEHFFIQSFVPHDNVQWKVCVIGSNVVALRRQSVANDHAGPVGRVSKEPAADNAKGSVIVPKFVAEAALRAADSISSCLSLSIFNFDMVAEMTEQASGYRVAVLDVNYFPSFHGVPKRFDLLADHIRRCAATTPAPDAALARYPIIPAWAQEEVAASTGVFVLRALSELSLGTCKNVQEEPKPPVKLSNSLRITTSEAQAPPLKRWQDLQCYDSNAMYPGLCCDDGSADMACFLHYTIRTDKFLMVAAVVAGAALWMLHATAR